MKKWGRDLHKNWIVLKAHQKMSKLDFLNFRIRKKLKLMIQINSVKMKKIEFKKSDLKFKYIVIILA